MCGLDAMLGGLPVSAILLANERIDSATKRGGYRVWTLAIMNVPCLRLPAHVSDCLT